MISDFILSIFAFYFYLQHRHLSKKWAMFFLFMGISALIGGVYHDFTGIGEEFRFLSWSLFSTSLIFAQLAAYQYVKNRTLKSIFILKTILLLFLSILNANFVYIIIDTVVSMLGFIVIGNLFFLKSLSNYISYGILVSVASAFIVIFNISFHPQYLTSIDIGHYISILSIVLISRGVREDSLNNLEKVTTSKL